MGNTLLTCLNHKNTECETNKSKKRKHDDSDDTKQIKQTKRRKRMCAKKREKVWKDYYGDQFTVDCSCKQVKIDPFNFEVGHITAKSKGGSDLLDNLIPICTSCNRSMGTQNLVVFYKKLLEV
jgi:5-methylcytosine-specific restriction endonuclease McrA